MIIYLALLRNNMIIQNFKDLAITDKKKDCLEILEAGLRAAEPENIISPPASLSLSKRIP